MIFRGLLIAFFGMCAVAHADGFVGAPSYDKLWWCVRGADLQPCQGGELDHPKEFRQIVVLPTGFTESEYDLFRQEFSRVVQGMSEAPEAVYSSKYRAKLVYVGYWTPGGSIDAPTSKYGGKIAKHPFRGTALSLRPNEVIGAIDQLREGLVPNLRPFGVAVLYNSLVVGATANANPPGFMSHPYGIAKLLRSDLSSPYISTHELGHGALNFVDEYTEAGFEEADIHTVDMLTPLAIMGQNWSNALKIISNLAGNFDYRISEVLAANGNENVDTTQYPSRVATVGYTPDFFEYQGGMFFGRGTYHHRGSNLMNAGSRGRPIDDGFAYEHTPSQTKVIEQVFEHPDVASRPNDRIRAAGPLKGWPTIFGSTTNIMLFDADKNHHFHPTNTYEVQVGWWERHWKVCWAAILPYPCHNDTWVTAQKDVVPAKRTMLLKSSALYSMATFAQEIACFVGVGSAGANLCDISVSDMVDSFVPTIEFPVPYQETPVPAQQWFTKYYWRFRTDNGTFRSGWTGWDSFQRYF